MNCHLSEITEHKYTSLIKMIILEENFKWHLEAFASEFFIYMHISIISAVIMKMLVFKVFFFN